MLKKILFWPFLILLGSCVFGGASLYDKFLKEQEKQPLKSEQDITEEDCVKRLYSNVEPLLLDKTCDHQNFKVPNHWALISNNICNGQVMNTFNSPPGLDSFEFRKAIWNSVLYQIAYLDNEFEPMSMGVDDANNFILSSLLVIGGSGQIFSEALYLKAPANSNFLEFIIKRDELGKYLRDLNGFSKYTTYKNAILSSAHTIEHIASNADLLREFSQNNAFGIINGLDYDTIKIEKSLGNVLIGSSLYIEFLYQLTQRIVQIKNDGGPIDPALYSTSQEIYNTSVDDNIRHLIEYLRIKQNQSNFESAVSLTKSLGVAVAIGTGAVSIPVAGAIVLGYDILTTAETRLFYWDKHPYIYPLFMSSLAYTLASINLKNDNFGLRIRTLALLAGDGQMIKYFDVNLFNLLTNIWNNPAMAQLFQTYAISMIPSAVWIQYFSSSFWNNFMNTYNNSLGNRWDELLRKGNGRNEELMYLAKGYKRDEGSPCSAKLKGRVLDEANVPLFGANVSIINEKYRKVISNSPKVIQNDPTKMKSTKSDENGYFFFNLKEDGNYIIDVSKEGYCSEEVTTFIKDGKPQYEIIKIILNKPKIITQGTLNTIYRSDVINGKIMIIAEFNNETCEDVIHYLPYGTTFYNKVTSHQNILLGRESNLIAFPNSTSIYYLPGYCISRYRMGATGELKRDTSLSKAQYENLTKIADSLGYNDSKSSDVQNAVWYFSDNTGIEKNSVAEQLVKTTNERTKFSNRQTGEPLALSMNMNSSLGALLSTVLIALPLFGYVRKFFS